MDSLSDEDLAAKIRETQRHLRQAGLLDQLQQDYLSLMGEYIARKVARRVMSETVELMGGRVVDGQPASPFDVAVAPPPDHPAGKEP